MPAAVDLITISREFGAGGGELAHALGARLGWRVLDADVVRRVAERLALSPESVEARDEHAPPLLSRIAAALLVMPPEAGVTVEQDRLLDVDAVPSAAREVIEEAARTPPLIVVGHGSQCMFHDRPGTFHVRVIAPVESRAARVHGRLGLSLDAAADKARRMDGARGEYVRRYFHRDWRDGLLYDIQVNTGRVSIDRAASSIAMAVRGPGSTMAPPGATVTV